MRELSYKVEWNDRIYHKINPWYANSQTCSKCGEIKYINRDENASKNIIQQGLRELGIAI